MSGLYPELSEPIELYAFTPSCKLIMQFKLSKGDEMIDLRIWRKWSKDQQFHPDTGKGLFIVREQFEEILPKIQSSLRKQEILKD